MTYVLKCVKICHVFGGGTMNKLGSYAVERLYLGNLNGKLKIAYLLENKIGGCAFVNPNYVIEHLDDFEIKLGYVDETVKGDPRSEKYTWIPLRTAGSLGQQRTATLALKIAEMFLYKKYYGEKPTLLLDDVLSELDESRCRKLMEYCKTFDTIITCTEWNYPAVPDRLFKVNDGVVEELPIDPELKTRFEAQNVEAEKFEQAFEKAENEIENITE